MSDIKLDRDDPRIQAIDAIAYALMYYTDLSRLRHPNLTAELREAVALFVDEREKEFETYYEQYGDYIRDMVDEIEVEVPGLMDRVIDYAQAECGLDYLSHERRWPYD